MGQRDVGETMGIDASILVTMVNRLERLPKQKGPVFQGLSEWSVPGSNR